MAAIDALKSKNTLVVAVSVVGAIAVDALLGRRGSAPDAVGRVSAEGGDLVDDLRESVGSVARKAKDVVPSRGAVTSAAKSAKQGVRGDRDGGGERQSRDGGEGGEIGLDELAQRREARRRRREQRSKAV
jgi:hypothetical protein